MVLFRTEDYTKDLDDVISRRDILMPTVPMVSDTGAETFENTYNANAIIRTLAYNYKIVGGQLESAIWAPSTMFEVFPGSENPNAPPIGSPLSTAASPNDVGFWVQTDGEDPLALNVGGYWPGDVDSPVFNMGIQSPGKSFVNHNLSISRTLATPAVDGSADNYLSEYGLDHSLQVKPVYNYRLEEYEKYYKNGVLGVWMTGLNQPGKGVEKMIPNFYYTLLAVKYLPDMSELGFGRWDDKPLGKYDPLFELTPEGFLKTMVHAQRWYGNDEWHGLTDTGPQAVDNFYQQAQWIKLVKELTQYELSDEGAERNSIVVLTPSFYDVFAESIEKQKKLYPFYNEISIPVIQNGTVFRDFLKQANLYDDLQYWLGCSLKLNHLKLRWWDDPDPPIASSMVWNSCDEWASYCDPCGDKPGTNPVYHYVKGQLQEDCWTLGKWTAAAEEYELGQPGAFKPPGYYGPDHPGNAPPPMPGENEAAKYAGKGYTWDKVKGEVANAAGLWIDEGTLTSFNEAAYDGYKFVVEATSKATGELVAEWHKLEHEVMETEEGYSMLPYAHKSVKVLEYDVLEKIIKEKSNILETPVSYREPAVGNLAGPNVLKDLLAGQTGQKKNIVDLPFLGARKKLPDCSSIYRLSKTNPKSAAAKNYAYKDYDTTAEVFDNMTVPLTFFGNSEEKSSAISSLLMSKAAKIIKLIVNKAQLLPSAVFKNNANYSEILFFEVAKYKVPEDIVDFKETICQVLEGPPTQTFVLPNDPKFKEVNYVDSQILYGAGYIYQIFAHTLSIGNALKRKEAFDIGDKGDLNFFAWWRYDNELDVKLLRVPYYNVSGIDVPECENEIVWNVDSPPMPPEVSFFPFKNISNKIGFWFNVQIGELLMARNKDLETDANTSEMNKYWIQRFSMGLQGSPTNFSEDLLYKTDDYGGTIEVYRIPWRPKSYSEFKDKKIADINVIGNKTLIDDIVPNQDYYYTFRMVDSHNLCSNPTPIYHIKMITHDDSSEQGSVHVGSESSQPVLFHEIISLATSFEDNKHEESFKKYLLVEPSINQTFLNFDNFENSLVDGPLTATDIGLKPEELNIGTPGYISVYGKKFKIRLTSKQTGRKLDVNVKFNNVNVKEDYNK